MRARRLRLLTAALVAAAAIACGGEDEPSDVADGSTVDGGPSDTGDASATDARLTLGTGFASYEPIQEGETLMFLLGPQGGFHIWGAIEAWGVTPGMAQLDFFLDYEGEVVAQAFYADELGDADETGRLVYTGVAVAVTQEFQDRMRIPPEILGLDPRLGNRDDADFEQGEMVLRVEVTDAAGNLLTDRRDVTTACCVN